MKLPGGERAIITVGKIGRYCLDPARTDGGHKALVFASALGPMLHHADPRAGRLEASLANQPLLVAGQVW